MNGIHAAGAPFAAHMPAAGREDFIRLELARLHDVLLATPRSASYKLAFTARVVARDVLAVGTGQNAMPVARAWRAVQLHLHVDKLRGAAPAVQVAARVLHAIFGRARDVLTMHSSRNVSSQASQAFDGGLVSAPTSAEWREARRGLRAHFAEPDAAPGSPAGGAHGGSSAGAAPSAPEAPRPTQGPRNASFPPHPLARTAAVTDAARRAPDLPGARANPPTAGFGVIDGRGAAWCALTPSWLPMLERIPSALREHWAQAQDFVFRAFNDATDELDLERALKWILLLPRILLRTAPRGGAAGDRVLRRRFALFAAREFGVLLADLEDDTARRAADLAEREATRARSMSAAQRTVRRALRLIEIGEISRAVALLNSHGVASTTNAAVVAALLAKHPARTTSLPDEVFRPVAPAERVGLDLVDRLRGLRAGVAPGPSGMRNEYMKVLVGDYAPAAAADALRGLHRLGEAYVNDELPLWFYKLATGARLIALNKTANATADQVRPIGVGEVLRRVFTGAAVDDSLDALARFLAPVQLGVGVKNVAAIYATGLRMLTATCPDHYMHVQVDITNAHNEFSRAACLTAFESIPSLRHLVPMLRADMAPESPLYLHEGGTLGGAFPTEPGAPGTSAEGGQQGCPYVAAAFAVVTHSAFRDVDDMLAQAAAADGHAGCGGARFAHDDGVLVGPPQAVTAALVKLKDALRPLNLHLNIGKCSAWSRAGSPGPPGVPLARGLTPFGVPIGAEDFIGETLHDTATGIEKTIERTADALSEAHASQALWTVTRLSLANMWTYWTQLLPPRLTADASARIDAKLLKVTERAFGWEFGDDALALRRLRLPVRLRGGALRAHVDVAPAAFAAALARALPTFIDARMPGGVVRRGYFNMLAPHLGADSFDFDRADDDPRGGPLATFLASSLPFAADLRTAWDVLVARAGDAVAAPLDKTADFACGKQRDILRPVETALARILESDIQTSTTLSDMLKARYHNVDRWSAEWLLALPDAESSCSDLVFHEIAANYFLQPSPALRGLVGRPIPGAREPCDPYGHVLCATALRDNSWVQRHDTMTFTLHGLAKRAGLHSEFEVRGKFTQALPADVVATLPAEFYAPNRGYVPDLLVRLREHDASNRTAMNDRLFDVKMLNACPTYYRRGSAKPAVDAKAESVHPRIEAKLRKLDHEFCGTAAGADGPLVHRLNTFGRVGGLVFGTMGEASQDAKALVDAIGNASAAMHAQRFGRTHAPSAAAEARTFARQTVAMAALRARAVMLLDRTGHITLGASQRASHRAHHARCSQNFSAAFDFATAAHENFTYMRSARGGHYFRRR